MTWDPGYEVPVGGGKGYAICFPTLVNSHLPSVFIIPCNRSPKIEYGTTSIISGTSTRYILGRGRSLDIIREKPMMRFFFVYRMNENDYHPRRSENEHGNRK
jgi:hypothetical protein